MLSAGFPWLTVLIVLPLVGAAVVWSLPASARAWSRHIALGVSLLELVLAALVALSFDTAIAGTHQFT
jgi:NADH-quinone oxidoreductase subunit M